mgnify:CR=1 FL=1
MKINWKVRLKNKTWLLAFLGTVAAFVYQILGLADIGIAVNLLVTLGIVQDPTTAGVSDSAQALEYTCPADNCRMHKHA